MEFGGQMIVSSEGKTETFIIFDLMTLLLIFCRNFLVERSYCDKIAAK